VIPGIGFIAFHLIQEGRFGSTAARAAAPAAVIFVLVSLAGALSALMGAGNANAVPNLVGGFSAVGAILLALTVAAEEESFLSDRERPVTRVREAKHTQVEPPSIALEAIAASHQGVFELDLVNNHVRISSEAAIVVGLSAQPERFTLADWVERIHPDDRSVFSSAIRDFASQPGLAFRVEFRVVSDNSRNIWLELRATSSAAGNNKICRGLLADITTRKEPEQPAPDTLTGLPTKAALIDALAHQSSRNSAVLAVLDIDRFKSVHVSLGDGDADRVLAVCARRLEDAFAPFGRVFRVGGDGFAVLFGELDGASEFIGAQIVQTIGKPISIRGRKVFLSVSVGIAGGTDADDAVGFCRNAELALFHAKRQGGGCVRLFTPESRRHETTDAVALEADLRQALANHEFDVVYQPIMRLADGTVSGFEALLRWTHPLKGRVETQEFIAHSEESGAIFELGKLALTQAAVELACWQRYFPLDPALTVSVNLSRRQLQDREFDALLADVVSNGNIHRGTLRLELTETALAEVDDVRDHLMRLKSLGAGLSLDDFGTGLSALSQLRDLPFDTIKLDKSFLDHEGNREKNVVILRSIVQLAHELNRTVVAEGIETAHDAQSLREMGCEFAQGYFFSPPLPRSDVLAFIARHHAGSGEITTDASSVSGMGRKPGDVDPQLA
jgi:diguanylate cyclase (GGDEF)-like protein